MLPSLLIIAFFLPCCLSVPVIPKNVVDDVNFFKNYFHQFFLTKEKSQNYSLESQLRFLQNFFKLEETGWLDEPTRALIQGPRCGVRDIADYSFFPGMPRIENNPVTYRIVNYPTSIKPRRVEIIMEKAMQVWSNVTSLKFQRVYKGHADIEIFFFSRDHGDFYPFDGKGKVLAHAFPPHPYYPGAIHFDNDEEWSYSENGTNLFLVAVHEIGHALGLNHSQDPNAIMFPPYKYRDTEHFTLGDDDIKGIQTLYSSPKDQQIFPSSSLGADESSSKESKISPTLEASQ
ncbi:matrix metalloproteinase-26 [Sarcophilus harrisii]